VKEPNGRGVLDHPPQRAIAHKADDDIESGHHDRIKNKKKPPTEFPA
jgi:hypothetical protein